MRFGLPSFDRALAGFAEVSWDYDDLQEAHGKKFMLRFLPYLDAIKEASIGYTPRRFNRGYGYGRWEEFFHTRQEAQKRAEFLIGAGAIEDAEIYKEAPSGYGKTLVFEWREGDVLP